ncbi:MAG: hypothetical protein WCO77_01840 [bacterium]
MKKLARDGFTLIIRGMKTLKFLVLSGVLVAVCTGFAVAGSAQGFDVGARYHKQHSEFSGLPYGDGDWTYGAAYEIHDDNALFQLACGFTPELTGKDDLDYGITPELNLLAKDGIYQGGVGILSTYTRDSEGKGDWMDMYWQLVLGLNFPLGKSLSIQANAYYVFENWDALSSFKFDDVEFGGYLGYKF